MQQVHSHGIRNPTELSPELREKLRDFLTRALTRLEQIDANRIRKGSCQSALDALAETSQFAIIRLAGGLLCESGDFAAPEDHKAEAAELRAAMHEEIDAVDPGTEDP